MRSRHSLDLWTGLLVAGLLVGVAAVAAVAVDRYAEQHGHCPPLALIDVERPQRLQGDGQGHGVEGVHACSIHLAPAEKNVRGGRS